VIVMTSNVQTTLARPSVAPRRQARSEATRLRILEATIASLRTRGLAGTSTLQIQVDAGVSRGRLLHHFPLRRDLLIAAVQHLAKERFAALRTVTVEGEGAARVRDVVELLWSIYFDDLFWAAAELWLGARTDDDLREALLDNERQLARVARLLCDDLFGPAVTSRPGYDDLREVLVSSMRGVALTYAYDRRPMASEPMVEVWYRMMTSGLRLVEPA
jgi:AcrR family transcriptional regulator